MINAIFERLASDASRNFKIDILKQNHDNDMLKYVITLALDPFTQFYIRKIPTYGQTHNTTFDLGWALHELRKLSGRQLTGNAAIEHLTYILSSLTKDDAKVVERIIQKDLKCGVSEATVNAVWPGLIHDYPCMLASAHDTKLLDRITFPAFVQLKMDGMRFNVVVRNGAVEFRSRNGKEIQIADPLFGIPFIELASYYKRDMVFDGELVCINETGQILDRKTGNGILNKAVKGTQSREEGSMVRATLWDAIPCEDFVNGLYDTPYKDRLNTLDNNISMLAGGVKHLVSLVKTNVVNDMSKVQTLFEKYLEEGQEGLILKTQDMIWENKRSKSQIKFKGEMECDLRVVDWVEGTGKHVGRLGALTLESADHRVKVNVGTGFSDADRSLITVADIGRIVAVKYNARIKDKRSDTDSLFLPVFVCIREDKDVADCSDQIK